MKLTFIFCLCFTVFTLKAQTTITFQPDAETGKDANVHQLYPNQNNGNSEEFITFDWTFSGAEALGYSLLEFDISSIPANVEITDARLFLYHNPTSSSAGQAGNNASNLKLITSSWNENSVTWNTMPTTSNQNQITLITSASEIQNYENINVLNFVTGWYNNSQQNNGLMLEIIDKNLYNSMKFCSSDYQDENLRPKLVVTYQERKTCVTIQPDSKNGKDANVHQLYPDQNNGNNEEFVTFDWTFSGVEALGYSLIEFDLSNIPDNVVVTDAKLSLYHNPTSSSAGHAGNNSSNLKLITSSWNENTVTWNTMPTTSNQNQITLTTSTSQTQNYENINVLNFVTDWHNNPQQNNGVMLEIIDKNLYNSMKFCSSDYQTQNLRPKLEVCYLGKQDLEISNLEFSVYPNPTNGEFKIVFKERLEGEIKVNIYDASGKIILKETVQVVNSTVNVNINTVSSGMYIIQLQSNNLFSTQKIIVN